MPGTLSFEYAVTPKGIERHCRMTIDDAGRIASLESGAAGPWDGAFALPGMPNAHSHAFQRALVGIGESPAAGSFWAWRESMYRVANAIDAEDLYVISLRAFTDMLRAGFTSVGEFHYIHHAHAGARASAAEMAGALREAARDTGIRLVLLPVFYQRGGFDRPPVTGQRRFIHESLEDFGRLLEAVRDEPCGIAPHSLRAVPLSQLPALIEMADAVLGPNCPIHIHVSEQRREVEECRAFHGRPPIECLSDTVPLGPRWSLVHSTHAQAHEVAIIADKKPNLVLCPLTEAYLGDGLFPLTPGSRFAVGSDSNARIDAIEELRWAEYGQRLRLEKRSLLADEKGLGLALWMTAAEVGATSIGQPVGKLVPGAFADVVVLNTQDALFAGVRPERILDAWIVAGTAAQIAAVYVGGRRCVDQGATLFDAANERFAHVMDRVLRG